MVGMGCSSFSAFFLETEEGGDELSLEKVRRDHPRVQGWIDAIKHAVLERGVNLLDTAPWYGHGVSEVVVGWAMEEMLLTPQEEEEEEEMAKRKDGDGSDDGATKTTESTKKKKKKVRRSDVIINTKVGRYDADPSRQFDFSYDRVLSSAALSVERMKCRYVDVLQLHDPEFAPSIDLLLEHAIPAMVKCRDELGLCRALGVTGYPLEVQHEILLRSASSGAVVGEGKMVFDQALAYGHYNLHDTTLFDRPVAKTSDDQHGAGGDNDSDVVDGPSSQSFGDYCLSRRVGLLAAAPLSMGLFVPSKPPPEWHPASESLQSACVVARRLCEDGGANVAELATLFALAERRVACTLIGMKDRGEVDRAVDAALRIADAEAEAATKAIERDGKGSDGDAAVISAERVLEIALSRSEHEALRSVRDSREGPFARVWEKGEGTWDGRREAKKFWEGVKGGRTAAEGRMRSRRGGKEEEG